MSKGKEIARVPPKPPISDGCYRWGGYGHVGAQCRTNRSTLIIEDTGLEQSEPKEEASPDNLEDETCLRYRTPSDDEVDGEDGRLAYLGDTYDYSPTRDVPLWVVRCVLTQPKPEDDWHRTNIFYTYAKFGENTYKLIIDSGSCTNAVSTSTLKKLGLTSKPHPCLYKVAWVNTTSIPVF